MINPLDIIALNRLHLLVETQPKTISPTQLNTMVAQIALEGFQVKNPYDLGVTLYNNLNVICELLGRLKGSGGNDFVPLFEGFPENLPKTDDWFTRVNLAGSLMVGETNSHPPCNPNQFLEALSEIGNNIFWPASSVPQSLSKTTAGQLKQKLRKLDKVSSFKPLRVVDVAQRDIELTRWLKNSLQSPSSISNGEIEDLELILPYYVDHLTDVEFVNGENKAVYTSYLWKENINKLAQMILTPDDILRMFAQVTHTDVSLTHDVVWPKLNRMQRRVVLDLLEKTPRREEIFRRRDLWRSLVRSLHPHTYKKAPQTAKVFLRLNESRTSSMSPNVMLERYIREGDLVEGLPIVAKQSPGVFLRNLVRLANLVNKNETQQVALLQATTLACQQMSVRYLYQLLEVITELTTPGERIIFAKRDKIMFAEKNHTVDSKLRDELLTIISCAIAGAHEKKSSWENEILYIDDALFDVTIPGSNREQSSGLWQVGRGSKIRLTEGNVMRFFMHWKEPHEYTSDLDLSVLLLDVNFGLVDQVSWTNLASCGITHSGDITSAPYGAEEFIDVDFDRVARLSPQIVYVVPVVYRYSGPTFNSLEEASVGWMMRTNTSSEFKTYTTANVDAAFNLNGSKRYRIVGCVNVKERYVLHVDLAVDAKRGASVEDSAEHIQRCLQAIDNHEPISLGEVICDAACKRGAGITENKQQATITAGLSAHDTFNPINIGSLTDLLS